MYKVAEVISIEARALGNGAMRKGDYSDFKGLSCLAPFINIVRHPLWGRIVVMTACQHLEYCLIRILMFYM